MVEKRLPCTTPVCLSISKPVSRCGCREARISGLRRYLMRKADRRNLGAPAEVPATAQWTDHIQEEAKRKFGHAPHKLFESAHRGAVTKGYTPRSSHRRARCYLYSGHTKTTTRRADPTTREYRFYYCRQNLDKDIMYIPTRASSCCSYYCKCIAKASRRLQKRCRRVLSRSSPFLLCTGYSTCHMLHSRQTKQDRTSAHHIRNPNQAGSS